MQMVFAPQGNSLASSAEGISDSVVTFVKVGIRLLMLSEAKTCRTALGGQPKAAVPYTNLFGL
jgi:hypothetical protein